MRGALVQWMRARGQIHRVPRSARPPRMRRMLFATAKIRDAHHTLVRFRLVEGGQFAGASGGQKEMRLRKLAFGLACLTALSAAMAGCGEDDDSKGSGGTSSGGTGGGSTGGSAGSASGGTAGSASGGTAGSASGGTAGTASGGAAGSSSDAAAD